MIKIMILSKSNSFSLPDVKISIFCLKFIQNGDILFPDWWKITWSCLNWWFQNILLFIWKVWEPLRIADTLCNPKWNHQDLAIFLILIYVLRFIKTTLQSKFHLATPNCSQVIAVWKMCKMQTRLFYRPKLRWP